MGAALVGRDILFLPPADIIPHQQRFQQVCPAEIVVPHGAAGDAHPGALEAQLLPLQDVGAGGDIHARGLRVAAGNVVVEGVNALEDGNLVLPQPQGGAPAVVAHLAGELEVGDDDLLPPGQPVKGLVQQFHVQQFGGLVVDVPLRRAGGRPAVEGLEVVVHGHRVGVDPPALQLPLHLHGRGGLARAGGTGQEHDGALLHPRQDLVHGGVDALLVVGVTLGQKGGRVPPDFFVDLTELIGHVFPPLPSVRGVKLGHPALVRADSVDLLDVLLGVFGVG